jgi:hypothetical protein
LISLQAASKYREGQRDRGIEGKEERKRERRGGEYEVKPVLQQY